MTLVPEDPRLDDFGRTVEETTSARSAASRQVREAIEAFWICPENLEGFPAGTQGDELRELVKLHGLALAAHVLSNRDGGRSKKVQAEAQEAREWLQRVRCGDVSLAPLVRRGSGPSGSGRISVVQVLNGTDSSFGPGFFDRLILE